MPPTRPGQLVSWSLSEVAPRSGIKKRKQATLPGSQSRAPGPWSLVLVLGAWVGLGASSVHTGVPHRFLRPLMPVGVGCQGTDLRTFPKFHSEIPSEVQACSLAQRLLIVMLCSTSLMFWLVWHCRTVLGRVFFAHNAFLRASGIDCVDCDVMFYDTAIFKQIGRTVFVRNVPASCLCPLYLKI